jgi:hypothetical protein
MDRYCPLCGRKRPNKHFGGKRSKGGLCKACRRKPTEERERALQLEEITAFLAQKNISAKNIARLEALIKTGHPETAEFAAIVRDIALIAPRKKHRIRNLRRNAGHLLERLHSLDLLSSMNILEYLFPLDDLFEHESAMHEPFANDYGLVYELVPSLRGDDFPYGLCPAAL